MSVDDALVRRATLAGWVVLAVAWLVLTVTDATLVPAKLAFGIALVFAGVAGTAAGSRVRTRLAAGGFLVVGGAAFALSVVGTAGLPVGEYTLSLTGNIAVLAALALVLAGRLDDDGTAT